MTEHIRATTADGILTLVMDRPDKKNALTDAMYAAMADAIEGAQTDTAARVIVIRGEGDMFTAGNDLSDFASARPGAAAQGVQRFLDALVANDKPLVAAVQGRAVGVGTTMLLHCDHVILAEDTRLSTPFVTLGLVPEAASSLLLTARIGHLRAFSMLALGEAIGASDALALGLTNAVVPAAELVEAIEAVAARIVRLPTGAVQATKRLMRDKAVMVQTMAAESVVFAERLQSPEAKEAFAAFAERRPADFSRFG